MIGPGRSRGRRAVLALCLFLLAAAGPGSSAAAPSSRRPAPTSPVEIRCERGVDDVPKVTIRNRTGQRLEVELRGLAYAGRNTWEHWWTQHQITLAPHGSWSARIYEIRAEKVEVRDRHGRLLADFNLMKELPPHWWDTVVALHPTGDWQPFRRLEAFGQYLAGWNPGRDRVAWRVVTPSEFSPHQPDGYFAPVQVIGDLRAEALTAQQLEALRRLLQRGRRLILCGGGDLDRLRGWERAGLLAAPVRGVRTLPGLRALAERYRTRLLSAPLPVADVGAVEPPARVVLEEGGVPLVIERPFGVGRLTLITFDPTRPPFRGTPLEAAFWQEWASRGDDGFLGISVNMADSPAYRQVKQFLRLEPLPAGTVRALWLGYLLLLALVTVRRRIRWLVALSLGGSLAALALGPLLRAPDPVAGIAGALYLRSGDGRGWWRGSAEVMAPRTGIATLQVPKGSPDIWSAPRLRLPDEPAISVQPLLRRWMPTGARVNAWAAVPGGLQCDLQLHGDEVIAHIANRTPHALRDVTLFWYKNALLRLGDLPPGARTSRRLARVGSEGTLQGIRHPLPTRYGSFTEFVNVPTAHPTPLLLAHCPEGPLPALRMGESPIRTEGLTALLVAPSGFRPRGRFRLPEEAVAAHLVRAKGPGAFWGRRDHRGDHLMLEPRAWAIIELRLPAGAGRARWRRLELLVNRQAGAALGVQAFDRARQRWVEVAKVEGAQSPAQQPPERFADRWTPPPLTVSGARKLPLMAPEWFVNPDTDALLVRVENTGDAHAWLKMGVRGDGEAR